MKGNKTVEQQKWTCQRSDGCRKPAKQDSNQKPIKALETINKKRQFGREDKRERERGRKEREFCSHFFQMN